MRGMWWLSLYPWTRVRFSSVLIMLHGCAPLWAMRKKGIKFHSHSLSSVNEVLKREIWRIEREVRVWLMILLKEKREIVRKWSKNKTRMWMNHNSEKRGWILIANMAMSATCRFRVGLVRQMYRGSFFFPNVKTSSWPYWTGCHSVYVSCQFDATIYLTIPNRSYPFVWNLQGKTTWRYYILKLK